MGGDDLILAIVCSRIKAACENKSRPLLRHQGTVDLPVSAFFPFSTSHRSHSGLFSTAALDVRDLPLTGRGGLFFCSHMTFVFLVVHFPLLALQAISTFIGSQIREGEKKMVSWRLVCNSRRPLGSPRKAIGFQRGKGDGCSDVTYVSHPHWSGELRDGSSRSRPHQLHGDLMRFGCE